MTTNQIIAALLIFAMLGAVAMLGTGLVTMLRGKDITGEKSNKLMWKRVYFQGIAIALFALLLILSKK